MKIAFQGETGAFSEEAIRVLYPDAEVAPYATFEAVFEAVENGLVDRGVIPIENSLFGSVHVNYDLLQVHDLWISGELSLRIRHHLMVLPGVAPKDIQRIYSHPQALGQCQEYLRKHFAQAEIVPAYDTAGAAKMVAEKQLKDAAAIASAQAAREYGLDVLAAGIESNPHNYTRFLILGREREMLHSGAGDAEPYKTSIVYAMRENIPGALFKCLAAFALRDLDLYKIESRPLVGKPGHYLFYLDFAGSLQDETVRRALDHLQEFAASVKVLGSYPRGRVASGENEWGKERKSE
jgi:prephenate dehydratase